MRGFIFILCFYFIFFTLGQSFGQGTWKRKPNVFTVERAGAVGFSIGNKGYFGTGWQFGNNLYYNDFWEWDKATGTWAQKAPLPVLAPPRGDATGFSIGAFGYIGTGITSGGGFLTDFLEWNQATNTWAMKAGFPASPRAFCIGFSIGTKGYIGLGSSGVTECNDFWEWDQATTTWSQKANFAGGNRAYAVGFSIGNKGYVGTGKNKLSFYNDFWEYNPSSNTWVQKANLPGPVRAYASGFSIGTNGYIGTGADAIGNIYNDFYEWNQSTNTWAQKLNYDHPVSDIDHASFSIGCKGYFGCGANDPSTPGLFFRDFWEYTPDDLPPVPATVSGNSTICAGSSILLSASGGTSYVWSTGASANSISVSPATTTTYSVTVSTDCNSATVKTTVTVIKSGTASFEYKYEPCKSNCVQFRDQSINAFNWCWEMGDGNNSSSQNPCWVYASAATYSASLIINCNTACADTFSLSVPYAAHDTTSILYIPNAFSPNGDGENDALKFFIRDAFCMKEFSIVIYDRWGGKVYETTDVNGSWDGTFNGINLNPGAFTYYCSIVTSGGVRVTRKGNITLVQ